MAAMNVPEAIETERLRLRRHRMADLEAFVGFLSHPTAIQYMAFTPEQKTRSGAKQMLEYVISSYDSDGPIFSLTIADRVTDTYLGSCGFNPLDNEDGVEIYYTILPEHQNLGLATEAVKAIVDFVLRYTQIHRIVAYVVPENIASVRVAQKLGFVDAGTVDRRAAAGDLAYEAMRGRRYILTRNF